MASTRRWKDAGRAAKQATAVSQCFHTLRDMQQDTYIDAESILLHKKLGEGAYAAVHLGMLNGTIVAVKTLKPELLTEERDMHDFFHEAALLKKLGHSSIVKFVGVACSVQDPALSSSINSQSKHFQSVISMKQTASARLSELMKLKTPAPITKERTHSQQNDDDDDTTNSVEPLTQCLQKVMLIQEFMSRGTIKDMVTNQMAHPMRRVYSREEGLMWLIQIAKGLRYIHNAKPRIIHRDLKLENIMLTLDVDGTVIAKIGDFGLHAILKDYQLSEEDSSKLQPNEDLTIRDSFSQNDLMSSVKASYNLSGRTGSMMYMAPEVLHCLPYNEKSDVFSFSVIMYEVLNKMLLLAFVSCRGLPEEVENYAKGVGSGNRPKVPEDWPVAFSTLLRKCWSHDPSERPSMTDIVQELERLKTHGWIQMDIGAHRCGCCATQ